MIFHFAHCPRLKQKYCIYSHNIAIFFFKLGLQKAGAEVPPTHAKKFCKGHNMQYVLHIAAYMWAPELAPLAGKKRKLIPNVCRYKTTPLVAGGMTVRAQLNQLPQNDTLADQQSEAGGDDKRRYNGTFVCSLAG